MTIEMNEWLFDLRSYRLVPLFDVDAQLLVKTRLSTNGQRRLLCRSAEMEKEVKNLIKEGFQEPGWMGMIFVMGTGTSKKDFQPLFVGMTEKKGRKKEPGTNIAHMGSDAYLARWGDDSYRHIGALSNACFRNESCPSSPTHERWATHLFKTNDPPKLKSPVALFIAPWYRDSHGPNGATSLRSAKNEVIQLAFSNSILLLNKKPRAVLQGKVGSR